MEGENKKIHSEILFHNHCCACGKLKYAKGERPKVECIFCAIKDDNPNVIAHKLFQNENYMVCLNIYPYNPGHLMVIPTRHVEEFNQLTTNERSELFEAVIKIEKILKEELNPTGFNVGYNEGEYSGASIKHIHIHIVPRYKSELGFIDIISQTKIVLQTVSEIETILKEKIQQILT